MAAVKQISFDEVRKHRNRKSLWIVINNDVLDVTKFMDEHPGGADPLMEVAGTDGTQAFNDVGHSSDARSMLKKYKIGTLPPGEIRNAQSCRGSCPGQANLPRMGSSPRSEKTWRTFDGSPSSRSLSSRSRERRPESCSSGRVGTIIVPRESNLKWVLLLLGAVIILGFAYKKYSE